MVDTYIKSLEFVRAIQLQDTTESILACTAFVAGSRLDYTMVDMNSGISIKFPEWGLYAEFGNYIIKDSSDQFLVLCDDVFEAKYVKILSTKQSDDEYAAKLAKSLYDKIEKHIGLDPSRATHTRFDPVQPKPNSMDTNYLDQHNIDPSRIAPAHFDSIRPESSNGGEA